MGSHDSAIRYLVAELLDHSVWKHIFAVRGYLVCLKYNGRMVDSLFNSKSFGEL